ncbi:MAG: S41 family peptidase [bacterium]
MSAERAAPVTVAARPAADEVTEGVRNILQVLQSRGLTVDTNVARAAAIQAVVATIDPRARMFPAAEKSAMADEERGGTNSMRRKPVEIVEKLPGEICYLKLGGLYRGTGQETVQGILAATNGGATGMILDLRGAGGHGYDAVASLAGLFVEENSLIYSIRSRNGIETEQGRAGKGWHLGMPAMFLIDKGTTCASELLVAIVKGGFEVLVVGRATGGDSLVREDVELEGGDILYVGTKRVIPLQGASYDPGGVEPDIVVQAADPVTVVSGTNATLQSEEKLSDKDRDDSGTAFAKRVAGDSILQRALDILMGLRTLDARALKL